MTPELAIPTGLILALALAFGLFHMLGAVIALIIAAKGLLRGLSGILRCGLTLPAGLDFAR